MNGVWEEKCGNGVSTQKSFFMGKIPLHGQGRLYMYIPLRRWYILYRPYSPIYFHKFKKISSISAKFLNFPLFSFKLRFFA